MRPLSTLCFLVGVAVLIAGVVVSQPPQRIYFVVGWGLNIVGWALLSVAWRRDRKRIK